MKMKSVVELNDLEKSFFQRLLEVELDAPVHGTLNYENEALEMIVTPRISQDGHFEMDYSNASPFIPESQGGVYSYSINSFFGTHPLLERAWLSGDPVNLKLRISRSFPPPPSIVHVKAKLLSAGSNHSGRIALWENQITLGVEPIKEARFSLVGFPDFISGNNLDALISINRLLQPVRDQLPEGWTIIPKAPEGKIVLQTGCGWTVDICKQLDLLRGMVSHEGVVTRTDGREYRINELENLLEGLKSFFAFVAGDYCHPTVVIGYSTSKSPSWGQTGRLSEISKPRMNWFENNYTPFTGHYLKVLFPKFWEIWSDKSKEVDEVINLHVGSNNTLRNGNPKGALAESYAALETLASLTSGTTIRGDSDKEIDLALVKNEVPFRLVNEDTLETSYFSDACDELKIGCYNGVYLLNEVRNYVPHPLEPKTNAEIKPEVHNFLHKNRLPLTFLHDLSQFYFEHLFLAYCGPEFIPPKLGQKRFRGLLAEINAVPG